MMFECCCGSSGSCILPPWLRRWAKEQWAASPSPYARAAVSDTSPSAHPSPGGALFASSWASRWQSWVLFSLSHRLVQPSASSTSPSPTSCIPPACSCTIPSATSFISHWIHYFVLHSRPPCSSFEWLTPPCSKPPTLLIPGAPSLQSSMLLNAACPLVITLYQSGRGWQLQVIRSPLWDCSSGLVTGQMLHPGRIEYRSDLISVTLWIIMKN